MIDIDVSDIFMRSHGDGLEMRGRQENMFELRDTTNRDAVNNVCRKLLELMQAFENLRTAILACGDCVRLNIAPRRGVFDPMSSAVMMAAILDATSDTRVVFIDSDHQMEVEDHLVRSLHDAYDTSSYVRRVMRRLRRPAA